MYFLKSRGNGGYYQLTKVMQREAFAKMGRAGTPLEDQWLRVCLPIEGVPVPSLVGELRSHMSPGQKKNKKKKKKNAEQKQTCNKFSKDFKICPHQIILKKIKVRVDKLNNINTPLHFKY